MVAADSKAKFLQDAERYVLHGKVQQAIGEYLKIVKCDPDDVLILNTIGDLYLRQGKSSEANRYFAQVAENYVRNNFFLKAIAVYKKILNADPNNLEINSVMASLYAKQGLSIDARNQYQRIATLLEKDGNLQGAMEAYEKIVELDPANAAIQRKLAELYLSEGANDKAHIHWTGAARAQAKAGDYAGAADSYSRAMELNQLDVESMRGHLECCLQMKNPEPALNQLKKAAESEPENLDIRELLGHAYLASDDPESAAKAFQIVFSMDEERYENLFAVSEALLEKNQFDQASGALDEIIPVLISRRETDRAARLFGRILDLCPTHTVTMVKLASLYSATGDQEKYLETLDRIVDFYVERKSWIEALEYIEKILHSNPESKKHQSLHYKIFTEAYPDTPYVSPVDAAGSGSAAAPGPAVDAREAAPVEPGSSPEIVEADLLINYGLREKALNILLNAESRDPYDRGVRVRLLSLYKTEGKHTEAAEQCLLLAALFRRVKNEEAAQNYLAEAKQLSPELAESERDIEAFARRNGIELDSGPAAAPAVQGHEPEVDLSSDLLDIFFSGDQESGDDGEALDLQDPGSITETFPQSIPPQPSAKPLEEQLQEVDFYIRLGFHDEALGKLNEIAKLNPGHPELTSRYEKLGELDQSSTQKPVAFEIADDPFFGEPIQTAPPDNIQAFRDLELDGTLDRFVEAASEDMPQSFAFQAPQPAAQPVVEQQTAGSQTNELFADLMEEIGGLSDMEVSRESFEDHFSLGTAYRDMELHDEAVREFQLALKIADLKKDTDRVIQCCGMLSTCYLKKGMPSSALRWCQTGLNVADISSHEAMALRYDMGVAHSMSGSSERALECFDQIFGLDPSYRDVAQKIDELRACR